jgi:hypothetical protein
LSVGMTFLIPVAAFTQDTDDDAHHQIDQITVTATPLSRTVEELAQPTTVLFGDELAKKQSTSIGETLSQEPGLSSTARCFGAERGPPDNGRRSAGRSHRNRSWPGDATVWQRRSGWPGQCC